MRKSKGILCLMLLMSIGASTLSGCGQKPVDPTQGGQTTKASSQPAASTTSGSNASSKADSTTKVPEKEIVVEKATKEEFMAFMNDSDNKTFLVDARPQEAYSGWAIEGAKNGGHIKDALLYSARWLSVKMKEDKRDKKLKSYNKAINLNKDNSYIVYDYESKKDAAMTVAKYFKKQGIENVKYFDAKEIIDSSKDLVTYKNYDRFIPSEIVKVISDYKSGKTDELNTAVTEAVGITKENIDKVVLIDVTYGNVHESTYLTDGHIPGAVHLNTDAYERPRSYTPEKREKFSIEYSLIPIEEFRDVLCPEYGINKDSIVIASSGDIRPLARFGFMLRTIGVKYYAMAGNMTSWTYNGYRLDKENVVKPTSVDSFGSTEIPSPNEIVWMDEVKKILSGKEEGTVVGGDDFDTYDYHDLMGKIPGVVDEGNVISQNLDGTPAMREVILKGYKDAGIDTEKLIVPFCGDGWGASGTAYNAQAVDINNVKYWGEGWVVWSNRGNEFETYDGKLVHYDKYLDAVVDKDGNIINDEKVMKPDEKKN